MDDVPEWLLLSPFVLTSAYAVRELRRCPRQWKLAAAVLLTAAALIFWPYSFCWLWPLIEATGTADVIWIELIVLFGTTAGVFILHLVLVGLLMWKTDPDVPGEGV